MTKNANKIVEDKLFNNIVIQKKIFNIFDKSVNMSIKF